jgi:DUF2934 family protein
VSENPLDREARIRARAYHLWEEDGRPEGREAEFWERAETLIGMEENAQAGRLPNPLREPPHGDVEEAEIQENYGEFPDRLVDQGERQQTPRARARRRRST